MKYIITSMPTTFKVLLYSTSLQFIYMALAINIVDGYGLNSKTHCEFLPKNGNAVFAVHFTVHY